jgi:hypothetical protein
MDGSPPSITCLQIVVIGPVTWPELGESLPMSDRDVPLLTEVNGALMARDHD